ncbi:TPA: hypothetical protein HIT55_001261 [Escherichia fergusonii]|uniref:hypothetical protein n=1 Tax=Escherichia fergusonii TaxID=564 RepID=UPI000CF33EE5|nr:hypothetical protein [Escherichia fergusonii]MCP9678943.1 hypothetical protein [Escherichia fergusonii]MCP9697359.1 hypothetical protein [Escherichia fergusonii]PQI95243.1 hypothetical protein C5U38_16035 [Escherichia fergusonii]QMG50994.1 hypothetical protein HVY57_17565 [Escherichia fergusonii]HAI1313744.1 hypothetical protein [Escherichia fergusonii]
MGAKSQLNGGIFYIILWLMHVLQALTGKNISKLTLENACGKSLIHKIIKHAEKVDHLVKIYSYATKMEWKTAIFNHLTIKTYNNQKNKGRSFIALFKINILQKIKS